MNGVPRIEEVSGMHELLTVSPVSSPPRVAAEPPLSFYIRPSSLSITAHARSGTMISWCPVIW